jgi:hopanoid C-3 methylase HpnR
MKILAVHPGPLMYTQVFLRLEPLGLEMVAAAARRAGHQVRLIDLQVEDCRGFLRLLDDFRPEVVAFALNYLANVPEVVDLAKAAKARLPGCYTCVGGHSASFVAEDLLNHGAGGIDCVLRGEGEAGFPLLLAAIREDRRSAHLVPGAVTAKGAGPAPGFVADLDSLHPARDLVRHRRRYFLGTLDPCASVEFTRGCPWDCAFCSAWTFYGRTYRAMSPAKVVEDLACIRESGVFIVDDVAFIQERHGFEIGEAIARRGIKKQYYLETRGDVLLRNKDVFRFWRTLGMEYMFLGIEAIDADGLARFRKRVHLGTNFEALEFARSLGINVAINIIADPDWDRDRFETLRRWCMEVPEIVNVSVNTPYPGTETWHTESRRLTTRDYRLFDIQHAVLPTRLPLPEFYRELVKTQQVLNRKHMGLASLLGAAGIVGRHLWHGQTNFLRSLWKFNRVFNPERQLADHRRPVKYQMSLPPAPAEGRFKPQRIYVHEARSRKPRALDEATERFVDETRAGTDSR